MDLRWHTLTALWLVFAQAVSQELPLQYLEAVTVSDVRMADYAEGHRVTELKDTALLRNGVFLTCLLALNSNIYFKENGFGMVSSPSFRGTSASHTAVVWNGININSQLNGQVDFNTVNPFNYSSVSVRSGGGSVQFGSGAIGGSVHLNNDLDFEKHAEHRLLMGYGSYDARSANYNGSVGGGKWSSNLGINYNSSDNDYRFPGTDKRNENGEFEHLNLNANAGYLLGNAQALRLYHQNFAGDRNLSGTLVAPGRSRYVDNHYRTQLEWARFGEKAMNKIKVAHLYEGYRYYENKDSDRYTEGAVTTLLARYSLDVALSDSFRLHSFLQYNDLSGSGSDLGSPQRTDVSATAVLKHAPSEAFRHNLSLRHDFSTEFSAPLVFSWNGSRDFGPMYQLQWNASRNFRMPTFNDLYWQPGGNPDLRPEHSYQLDLGHRFAFGPASLSLNGYYIATEDMIRWLPGDSGLWSPENVDQVRIYGIEVGLRAKKAILEKQGIEFNANYAHTVSQDVATGEQLIYVPLNSANATLAYRFGKTGLFYQYSHVGPVSILGGQLDGYHISNAGVSCTLKTKDILAYRLGLTVNNLFNTYYENTELRPMPNRNVQTQLSVTF